MTVSVTFSLLPSLIFHTPHSHSPSPPNSTLSPNLKVFSLRRNTHRALLSSPQSFSGDSPENISTPSKPSFSSLLSLSVSAIVFLGLCSSATARAAAAVAPPPPLVVFQDNQHENAEVDKFEDEKTQAAFEAWKSKTYSLTVPLRVVTLRGSIPPSWVKDFFQSQGKRVRLQTEFQSTLEDIFTRLSVPLKNGKLGPKSTVAADLVSIGDSWLNYAIQKSLIEPMKGVESYDWFKSLGEKWKVYLRRNSQGELDDQGEIWAAPYRWGVMVIAYKKSKFQKHKLAPIEDWADLWRPVLAGKISMIDSPREVIGAVMKYMGASYNTKNINSQVAGGRSAVQQNLALLRKQVRLFDNVHYLKAFGVGDVWVAVGWSSDVLPVAKRMSDVTVIVPKSGTSIWADLWAIPAASKLETTNIGGRIRGPSPLVHQWIEFCLQVARSVPFKREVIPGSSPYALENSLMEIPKELIDGKAKLDTNLIAGVPPPEILARCEFLEPLSESALSDYEELIGTMQKLDVGLIQRIKGNVWSVVQTVEQMLNLKAT